MSESSEYLALRSERKAKAKGTIEANAKEAEAAKAKAQGKVAHTTAKAFEKDLDAKRAARAANYRRATTLPAQDELDAISGQEGE